MLTLSPVGLSSTTFARFSKATQAAHWPDRFSLVSMFGEIKYTFIFNNSFDYYLCISFERSRIAPISV